MTKKAKNKHMVSIALSAANGFEGEDSLALQLIVSYTIFK